MVVVHKREYQKLKKLWLSLLLQPGMMVVDREHLLDLVVGWVQRTSAQGVIVWEGRLQPMCGCMCQFGMLEATHARRWSMSVTDMVGACSTAYR